MEPEEVVVEDEGGVECVAICLCSRGIVQSRTMEAVYACLGRSEGVLTALLMTHDLPIPDAQNEAAKTALLSGAHYLWFVEEDMAFPEDALDRMLTRLRLNEQVQAVMATYKLRGGTLAHQVNKDGALLYCGLGCALFRAQVFVEMEPPWFRTDRRYTITETALIPDNSSPNLYGGHDVDLCYVMNAMGMRFELADFEATHFYLENWGERFSNQGTHKIVQL